MNITRPLMQAFSSNFTITDGYQCCGGLNRPPVVDIHVVLSAKFARHRAACVPRCHREHPMKHGCVLAAHRYRAGAKIENIAETWDGRTDL
eukprot:364795-Chlamydomonas_euryale.AAC.10